MIKNKVKQQKLNKIFTDKQLKFALYHQNMFINMNF